MYKFIFAIFLLLANYSQAESDYTIADEISAKITNQLIFEAFSDIEIEPELDLSISLLVHHNQPIQFSYLSKHTLDNHFPLLNNKFQYLRPRSPPFSII